MFYQLIILGLADPQFLLETKQRWCTFQANNSGDKDPLYCTLRRIKHWWTNIAIENGPFIDGLLLKNGDFPWQNVSSPEGKHSSLYGTYGHGLNRSKGIRWKPEVIRAMCGSQLSGRFDIARPRKQCESCQAELIKAQLLPSVMAIITAYYGISYILSMGCSSTNV